MVMAGIEDDNSQRSSKASNDFEDNASNSGHQMMEMMELKKSPSVPIGVKRGTNRRQFSLNLGLGEEEEEDFIAANYKRQLQLQRSNNINSDRCKKVSTASIGSYSSDLSPFINMMAHGRKVSSSESISKSTLSLKRSTSVEGLLRRMEKVPDAWRRSQHEDQQQVQHLLMEPGVTARPPMVLLTPRCDRKGGNSGNNNAELMAAHRRRKMRRRQAKLQKSGFKVFENYQLAISERRRSGDTNANSSTSSSAANSDDEQQPDNNNILAVPSIQEPLPAAATKDKLGSQDGSDDKAKQKRQGSMIRRKSWNDFDRIESKGDLEGTREVFSLDQPSSGAANPHLNAFSRGSRLRSTWTFGKKQQSGSGLQKQSSQDDEEERKRRRDRLRQGISKIAIINKMLPSKK